jgi:hypothetical protein
MVLMGQVWIMVPRPGRPAARPGPLAMANLRGQIADLAPERELAAVASVLSTLRLPAEMLPRVTVDHAECRNYCDGHAVALCRVCLTGFTAALGFLLTVARAAAGRGAHHDFHDGVLIQVRAVTARPPLTGPSRRLTGAVNADSDSWPHLALSISRRP